MFLTTKLKHFIQSEEQSVVPFWFNSNLMKKTVVKAELLQLNRTQFPSLGIFVSKKIGNRKNKNHFHYISFICCILGGLSFFYFQLFC